ncbi:MAG TPA: type II secretion system protein [Bacilli bacterium]|nr:type II secretion system protein [Bacilli bacterium]
MQNRKGFTLVELLAVIVILAVLVLLAVPSVLKMMDGAKENAFEIEAENIIDGAKLKYSDDLLDSTLPTALTVTISGSSVTGYCYDIYDLTDYVDKTFDAAKHVGSILIDSTNNNYYIWYTDNGHSITASSTVKGGSIAADSTTVTTAAATSAVWNNCLTA